MSKPLEAGGNNQHKVGFVLQSSGYILNLVKSHMEKLQLFLMGTVGTWAHVVLLRIIRQNVRQRIPSNSGWSLVLPWHHGRLDVLMIVSGETVGQWWLKSYCPVGDGRGVLATHSGCL